MSKTTICDHCGKTVEQANRGFYRKYPKIHKVVFWPKSCAEVDLDLCDKCFSEFIAWLKAGRK